MRFKPLVVTASVLLVAALAAIAIAVHLLVPRLLVPALAASVKAGTGRELGVGEVGVTLWPRPALVLSQVRFGNAPWGSLPWLAQAGRASAEFDVLGLLSGRLRIRQVTVTDASVLVETDADGVGNWVMGSSGAGKATWPDALEIDALALKALALTYRDGKTGKAMAVQIDSARIAVASPSHSIDLSARGTFDGKPVEAAGTTGPLAALIANAPFPVDLEGKIGAASIGVRGSVEKPRELGGLSLALRAQAAEFADVAALFGATVPPLGPVHGAAQLNGSVAAPAFTGIDLVVGAPARLGLTVRGDLNGAAAAAGGYEWQSGGIDLLVEGAQFSDLARWLGMSLPALGPYRIAARVTGSTAAPALPVIDIALGGRGMPQITLRGSVADLRTASGIDMKVAASATHWWRLETATQGPRLPPFQASARVRGTRQGYRVDDLELKIADSAVNASLQVVQGGPRLRVVGKVTSPLIDLARLPPAPGATAATAAAAVSGASRPADHWKLADVDLELQIGRLVLPDGRELQSGSGRLALDNGRLNASALQARLGGGTARLDGSVADPANLAGIELGVALQGGELAELFKFFGTSMAPMGPYQGQARLSGSLDALRLTAIDAAAGRPGQRLRASGQIDDALHWQGIALAITAQVNDSKAAGRLFGADLPRLPALQATARLSGPQGGYVFDDLKLALGRTSVQGRVAFAPGEPRPRVTASLSGSLVDLSELMPPRPGPGATSPTLAVDVEADLRLDRVVLPDRRALGPVSGVARLTAGAVELKQFSVAVDGASAIVDGTIGKPLVPAELDLVVSAEVKRGAGLATFTGLNLRALPPFTASARLTDVPGGYALTGLKAAHAVTTMAGDVAVTRGAERFKVSATLRSPTLDASALAQPDCRRRHCETRCGGCASDRGRAAAAGHPARHRRRHRSARRCGQVRRRGPARPPAGARGRCRRPPEGRADAACRPGEPDAERVGNGRRSAGGLGSAHRRQGDRRRSDARALRAPGGGDRWQHRSRVAAARARQDLGGDPRLARRRCTRGGGPVAPAQPRGQLRPRDLHARAGLGEPVAQDGS